MNSAPNATGEAALRQEALAAARGADAIVAVLGHDCGFENEGRDRSDDELGLPPSQLALLQVWRNQKGLPPLSLSNIKRGFPALPF